MMKTDTSVTNFVPLKKAEKIIPPSSLSARYGQKPYIVIPEIMPPALTGEIVGNEWDNCVRVSDFAIIGDKRRAREQTECWVGHDHLNLYFCMVMHDFALDPVSNYRQSFRAEYLNNGFPVNKDDSIEIHLISPLCPNQSFSIGINANGAFTAINLECDGSCARAIRTWRPEAKVFAAICDGFWIVKLALPLQDFHIAQEKHAQGLWRLQFVRHEQCFGEISSWVRVRGRINDPQNLGYAHWTNISPIINLVTEPMSAPHPQNLAKLIIKTQKHFVGMVRTVAHYDHDNLPPDIQQENLELGKNAERTICLHSRGLDIPASWQCGVYDGKTGELVYQSQFIERAKKPQGNILPLIFEGDLRGIERVYFNVQEVALTEKAEFLLSPGANVMALAVNPHCIQNICFSYNNHVCTLFDGGWLYSWQLHDDWKQLHFKAEGWKKLESKDEISKISEQLIYLRRIFLSKASIIFPSCPEGVLYVSAHTCYPLQVRHKGLQYWNLEPYLEDYVLYLDLPVGFMITGASSKAGATFLDSANKWRKDNLYSWAMTGTIDYNGHSYNRYAIKSKEPAEFSTLCVDSDSGLYDACTIGLTWDGAEQGDDFGLYYFCEAKDGSIREVPNFLPIKVIDFPQGKAPKQIRITAGGFPYHNLADHVLMSSIAQGLRNAGVTDIICGGDCNLPKLAGLRQFFFFGYTHAAHDAVQADDRLRFRKDSRYFELFPGKAQIHQDGHRIEHSVCPAIILTDENAASEFKRAVHAFIDRIPHHNALFWDCEYASYYEKGQSREAIGTMACFCKDSLKIFAGRYGITEQLTVEKIGRKYLDEWIDFHTTEIANMMRLASEAAHERGFEFVTYCGYYGEIATRRYSFDYRKIAPSIDWAMAGYGRSVEVINSTKKILGGKPLVGGLLSTPKYPCIHNPAEIIQTVLDCGGGALLWWEDAYDARKIKRLAQATLLLGSYEVFFVSGKDAADEILLNNDELVYVRKWQNNYLIACLNVTNDPVEVRPVWRQSHRICDEVTNGCAERVSLPIKFTLLNGEFRAFLLH